MTGAAFSPSPLAPLAGDQANALRRLVEAGQRAGAQVHSPAALTIAVASGKGGVGKTNLCVNLAAIFAQSGLRVTLLDGDLGLANADVLCNVVARRHLGHVVEGRCTLEEVGVEAPGGFKLIPGAGGVAALADLPERDLRTILSSLGRIERATDVLLIDCGAGAGRTVMSFLSAADASLIVTTPEPTALTDAYALIKLFHNEGGLAATADIALAINMATSPEDGRKAHTRINSVAERFLGRSAPLAGVIPWDPHVGAAVRARSPFVLAHPACAASRALRDVARAMRPLTPPARDARAPSGLARRLLARILGATGAG
ncbi:MAG: MinD/ParA family protein [Phycisphaerales bacterium]